MSAGKPAEDSPQQELVAEVTAATPANRLPRRQAKAYRVAKQAYPFACCVVCGLQLRTCLTVAHLDHNSGRNDPDNLAWLCWTHHWMFDADLYPIRAIKLMRARWQKTKGVPRRIPMIGAGTKAAATLKLSARAKKAWKTRREAET